MKSDKDRLFVSRRKFLSATATAISGLTLAACGSPAGPNAATTQGAAGGAAPEATIDEAITISPELGETATAGAAEGATAVPPTPTPEPTPTPLEVGSTANRVIFWHGLGGGDGATLVRMLQDYAKQQENVGVRSEVYGWDVFYQKLPTSVLAGSPPDMAIMHEWAIKQFAAQQLLQPVGEIFFDDGTLPAPDFNKAFQQSISPEGQPLGVLFDNHGWGMFYNTKLIKDAGLNPDKLPANGDEFIQWCLKLTVDENGKHPDENGFDQNRVQVWATAVSWPRPTLLSTLWQFGGGVTDDEAKKAILDSENSIKALQYWHDLIYKHRVAPVPAGSISFSDLFENSRGVFWFDGSWSLGYFNDRPELAKISRAAFLPSLSDGKQAAWMSAHVMVIPQGVSEEGIARAKNLIAWLSNNGATWATSGQVPARLSVQASKTVQDIWSVKVFSEQFQKIGKTEPPHIAIREIQQVYEPAFDAILNNISPLKEVATQANADIQAILDRA